MLAAVLVCRYGRRGSWGLCGGRGVDARDLVAARLWRRRRRRVGVDVLESVHLRQHVDEINRRDSCADMS